MVDINFATSSNELDFSDSDEEDLLFDTYVTEDGEIQRTPGQRAGPSQKNEAKRIPPDSPTMVMYIVLWVFTLGTFLIGKMVPNIPIVPNAVDKEKYADAETEWAAAFQQKMEQLSGSVSIPGTSVSSPLQAQRGSVDEHVSVTLQAALSIPLPYDDLLKGKNMPVHVRLVDSAANTTSALDLPLILSHADAVGDLKSMQDCVGQKKHWRAGDNVCVRIQVLRIACATIDDTAIPGTWAAVEFATNSGFGCEKFPNGDWPEEASFVPFLNEGSATKGLVLNATLNLRHVRDPEVLLSTLHFELNAAEKHYVKSRLRKWSVICLAVALGATLLLVLYRHHKKRQVL